MPKIYFLLLAISIPIILVSYMAIKAQDTFVYPKEGFNLKTRPVRVGNAMFNVKIADTSEGRKQGLSGARSIPANQGLLFVFPESGKYGFWMKDMNFPIDIIWANENLEIVDIEKDVLPESYPKTFYPSGAANYVLEINSGLSDAYGIKKGDKIQLGVLPDN